MKAARNGKEPVIGVSAHSFQEVLTAEAYGADFVVFGPVFEKEGHANPAGFDQLREACSHAAIPVLALGGVTPESAPSCLQAGAAGIAGIRLFQAVEAGALVRQLALKAHSL
jgi:thiamine-phosphate pyrophosphorylase